MNITRCGFSPLFSPSFSARVSASSIAVPPIASRPSRIRRLLDVAPVAGCGLSKSDSTSVEKRTTLNSSFGFTFCTQYFSESRASLIRSPIIEPDVSITNVTRLATISFAFTSLLGEISAMKKPGSPDRAGSTATRDRSPCPTSRIEIEILRDVGARAELQARPPPRSHPCARCRACASASRSSGAASSS